MAHNLSKVKHVVAVLAGKGGVGKSTVAQGLALYYQKLGYKVGLMDADLYGPSQKKMLSEGSPPSSIEERIIPAAGRGIPFISMAHFLPQDGPASVRAPIVNGVIKQFIHQVDWGELDFLLIDFPPGTGDIQLTLIQEAKISGAVVVTTPQQIALLDVARSVAMLREMHVPIAGVIENMSHLTLPNQEMIYPFGRGGGEEFARENNLYFLGKIPIEAAISRCCDEGRSIFDVDGEAARALSKIGENVKEQLEAFQTLQRSKSLIGLSQKDLHTFTIEWSDGKIADYCLSDLQRRCPCARCRGEPPKIDEEVQALRFEHRGGYALQVIFDRGCSKGIYPLEMLYRMGVQ